jgi:hypothetical protein
LNTKNRHVEERMEALEVAMESGNVPLMLVACRTLWKEIEQRQQPVVRCGILGT